MLPPSLASLAESVSRQRALDLHFSAKSAFYYLDRVCINTQPDPKPFGDAADPWQLELVAPKAAAVDGLCGLAPYSGPWSFLTILPRGHDKSSLEGRFANFCLKFSKRYIEGYLCAADLDQAKLIIEAMRDEAALNPHLFGDLTFSKYEATGPTGRIKALAADASSAYGLRGNLYIMDEIVHWKNDNLWTAVVSGREKVPNSLLVAISNAGFLNTWQHRVRQHAGQSKDWVTFERPGQLASWMPRARVDEMRKLLPPQEAERVLDNRWLDLAEQMDYLDRQTIELCVDPNWPGHPRADGRHKYVVVVDYGAKKDRTALLVLHRDDAGVCWTDRFDVWQGSHEIPIQVADVDAWLDEQIDAYDPVAVVMDEWQMTASIQRQQRKEVKERNRTGERIKSFKFRGGQGNYEIAQDLRAAVVTRMLRWNPRQGMVGNSTVVDELANLVTRIMGYGYRFDHTVNQHDDRAAVLGMGVVEAIKHPPRPSIKRNTSVVLPRNPENFSSNPLINRG